MRISACATSTFPLQDRLVVAAMRSTPDLVRERKGKPAIAVPLIMMAALMGDAQPQVSAVRPSMLADN